MRFPSSIERYRSGSIAAPPYDLTDLIDRVIWTTLGLYVDHRERRVSSGEEPWLRDPWEIEEYLRDLAAQVRGQRVLDYRVVHDTAQSMLEALFVTGGVADPVEIPQAFWDAGATEDQVAEFALVLDRSLAVLSYMLRTALGEMISQSEAARRTGIAKQSMAEKLSRRSIPIIRVGRSVLVPVAELEALAR